jgi:peptidase M23-like protein
MLLKLTTIAAVFLLWVPVAQAWTWPVKGPVLQAFSYDEAHPYAAGQHRGIDIGAAASGEPVAAPASGTVSFAGSVPTSGKSVTIETADGYSVTLTHLGAIGVARGAVVAEGAVVGAVGPSGTPEQSGPYVHLGIRVTADPNGYLDPLSLLPPLTPPPASTGSTGAGASSGSHSGRSHARGGSGGIVIHARAQARSSATPRQLPERSSSASAAAPTARRARSSSAESSSDRPKVERSSHNGSQARTLRRPPVAEPTPSLAVHSARPLAQGAVPPSVPRRRPEEQPLQIGLAAGPGLLAGLAAIATALVRLRRRRGDRGAAVVVPLRAPVGRREAATRSAA